MEVNSVHSIVNTSHIRLETISPKEKKAAFLLVQKKNIGSLKVGKKSYIPLKWPGK